MRTKARLLPYLVVGAAALLAYAATLTYDFVWDDNHLIRNSYNIHHWSTLWKLLWSPFLAEAHENTPYYRPLITLSFFLDVKLWGANPAGFHLTNVLAHVAASLGVLALARRLSDDEGSLAPPLAGLFFALHPLHTESVAFVSGRTDVLATFFFLAGLLAYARWRDSGGWAFLAASLLSYLLGLASKEVAVVLPLGLLAWDGIRRRDLRSLGALGRAGGRMAPYAAVLGLYLVARMAALGRLADSHAGATWADLPTRLLTSIRMAAWYAWVSIVPWAAGVLYPLVPDTPPPAPSWWVAAAFLVTLLALTAGALRFAPAIGFGALLFWLGLMPTIAANIVPAPRPILADRFLYLPTVGFCLALAAGFAGVVGRVEWTRSARMRPAPALAILLLLSGYGIATMWRNEDWKDEYRLYLRMVETSPDTLLARANLGFTQIVRGDMTAAYGNLKKAVEMAPTNGKLLAGLGVAEAALGDLDRALEHASSGDRFEPNDPVVLAYLATVRLIRGELDQAIPLLERALELKPNQVPVMLNLAVAQARLGRQDEAEGTLTKALALDRMMRVDPLFTERARAEVHAAREPQRAMEAWERYLAILRGSGASSQGRQAELAYAEAELDRLRSRVR